MTTFRMSMMGLAWFGLVTASGLAADTPAGGSESQETPQQREARMKWWREARFGLFIHWGPVSLKGTEIGWSRAGERRGTGSGKGTVPVEEYDNLYKQFNPIHFNADQWVQLAKDTGMKYLVFTSKHHDGFVNFDSKLTDYKITSPESPFGRDIVAELAKACHKAGIRLGFYYSPPDWHHPDYRTDHHAAYIKYLHGQLRELCTNYDQVDIIWFDGLGGKPEDWDAEKLIGMIRRLQPGVIVNNRAGLPADLDTPEQTIGAFQKDRPWETCMTLGDQWAFKPNDNIKSLKQCLQTLARVAGGDGNFLFNVGPMPDGQIEPRQIERLREMGQWLKRYGESIYATRGGPFKGSVGEPYSYTSTCKDNRIYLHILKWPESDQSLVLPPIPKKLVSSSVLTGGKVEATQNQEGITLKVPKEDRQEIDTIVVLELDGPAGDIAPMGIRPGSLAAGGKKAKASNVFQNKHEFGAAKAFDNDDATRWATDAGTKQVWLEVDLGKPQAIVEALVMEALGPRVQKFELQCKVDDQWQTVYSGTKLGEAAVLKFKPVTAQQIRLNILEASEGPTIWEFQLFAPR